MACTVHGQHTHVFMEQSRDQAMGLEEMDTKTKLMEGALLKCYWPE